MKAMSSQFILLLSYLCSAWCRQLLYKLNEETEVGTSVGNFLKDIGQQPNQNVTVQLLRPSLLFSLNATSGELRISSRLDRESMCDAMVCHVQLQATIRPQQYFQVLDIRVAVHDVNDNVPKFAEQKVRIRVSEQTRVGEQIALPIAKDDDVGLNGIQGYSLGETTSLWSLNLLSTGEPALVVGTPLDHETMQHYELTVVAFDGGQQQATLRIIVQVEDEDEFPIKFSQKSATVVVSEDAPKGHRIYQLQATDEDTGRYGKIRYLLVQKQSRRVLNQFAVDEDTGWITLRTQLDFESYSSWVVKAEAQNNPQSLSSDLFELHVNVTDRNDNAPLIDVTTFSEDKAIHVAEHLLPGAFVAFLSVRDLDSPENGKFNCALNGPKFILDEINGGTQFKLLTAHEFDREVEHSLNLTIFCVDNGIPTKTSQVSVKIVIDDINDNYPKFSSQQMFAKVTENEKIGQILANVNATDNDDTDEIVYTSDSPVVSIDAEGLVRTAIVFDHESTPFLNISIFASDGIHAPALLYLVIEVEDVNDEAPQCLENKMHIEILENTAINTGIAAIKVHDADSPPHNLIRFELLNDSQPLKQPFIVNKSTGEIKVSRALDREQTNLYSLSVNAFNPGSHSSVCTLTIKLADVNDNAPVIKFPNATNNSLVISNYVPIGWKIGQLSVSDEDEESILTFNLENSYLSPFKMNTSTGELFTRISLLSFDGQTFTINVSVSDKIHSTQETLSVLINSSVSFTTNIQPLTNLGGKNLQVVIGMAIGLGLIISVLSIMIILVKVDEEMIWFHCLDNQDKVIV